MVYKSSDARVREALIDVCGVFDFGNKLQMLPFQPYSPSDVLSIMPAGDPEFPAAMVR